MSVDEHVYIEQTVLPSPQHALPNPPNISHRYFRLVTMETLQGKAFFFVNYQVISWLKREKL